MRIIFILILLILIFNIGYPQNSELQKYIYEFKPLTIEVTSKSYDIRQLDTINLSVKFVNNSYDTIFIAPFRELKKISSPASFTLKFSNISEGNIDFLDSLSILKGQEELNFNFKLAAKDFYGDDFFHYVSTFLELSFIPSIDTVRRYIDKNNKLLFRNNQLFIYHSIIEACSIEKQLSAFIFRIRK